MHSGVQGESKTLVYRKLTGRKIIVIVTWRADRFISSGKRSEGCRAARASSPWFFDAEDISTAQVDPARTCEPFDGNTVAVGAESL